MRLIYPHKPQGRHKPQRRRMTPGAVKLFDREGFAAARRARKVIPHIAVDGRVSKLGTSSKASVDGSTTRHKRYVISQRCRWSKVRFDGIKALAPTLCFGAFSLIV